MGDACVVNSDCISDSCNATTYTCNARVPLFSPISDEAITLNLHKAYFSILAGVSGTLMPADVEPLILKAVNPDDQPLTSAQTQQLSLAIAEFKTAEGLKNGLNVPVHLGYISRGACFEFIKQLFYTIDS